MVARLEPGLPRGAHVDVRRTEARDSCLLSPADWLVCRRCAQHLILHGAFARLLCRLWLRWRNLSRSKSVGDVHGQACSL